jgi:hypothetical protein
MRFDRALWSKVSSKRRKVAPSGVKHRGPARKHSSELWKGRSIEPRPLEREGGRSLPLEAR